MYRFTYCFSISGTDWAGFARTGGVTDAPASFNNAPLHDNDNWQRNSRFAAVGIISFTPPPPLPDTRKR